MLPSDSALLDGERSALYDILDYAPAAILVVGLPDFRILAINAFACARLGIRPGGDLVGRTCAEVVPRFEAEQLGQIWMTLAGVQQSADELRAAPTQITDPSTRRWHAIAIREPGSPITRLLVMRFEGVDSPEQQLANSTHNITRALISTLDRDQLLDLILVQLHSVVSYDSASIMLRDEDGYYLAAARGLREHTVAPGTRVNLADPLFQEIEAAQDAVILRDAQESHQLRQPIGHLRGWMGVPLRTLGEPIGVMTIASLTPNRFTRADAARARAFAAYAAIAVRNAELYRQAREQSTRLALVGKIARDITASHDLRTIFSHLIGHLRDALPLSAAQLALADEQTGRLRRAAVFPEVPEASLPPAEYDDRDQPLLARTLAAARPIALAPCSPEAPILGRWLAEAGLQSCLIVPIVADQAWLGALIVASASASAFPRSAVATLADLAPHLAVAVQNAQLHQLRERALADLRIAQQRLVQSERLTAVGELVAGVAHELNNPLTAVLGFATILQQIAPAELQDDLAPIVEGATRARRIVHNLLTFARQREAHIEEVDLNLTVRQVLNLLSYQLRTDSITVEEQLQPGLPTTIADATAIKQVLLNLLNNARQALAEWDGLRRVVVRTLATGAPEAPRLLLEVADSGPGIMPEHLALVFEPFFTTKPVGEGTGLGLAICYGIVKQYDGEIRVESELGRGARFIVELPVRTLQQVAPPHEPPRPRLSVHNRRVLVVDDEPPIGALTARLLRDHGFEADVCHDGVAALAALERTAYDLIVSDIRMPAMSGSQLYEEVQRRAPHLARRVLFISGDTAGRSTREFLERTGSACVEKPFEAEELLAAVYRVLEEA